MADDSTLALNFYTDIKSLEMDYDKCNAEKRYFKITTNQGVLYECNLPVPRYLTPATTDKILRKMRDTQFPLNDMIEATRQLRNISSQYRQSGILSTNRLIELDQIDRGLDDALEKFQVAGLTPLEDTILKTERQVEKIAKIREATTDAATPADKLSELIRGLPDRVISPINKSIDVAKTAAAGSLIPIYRLGFSSDIFH